MQDYSQRMRFQRKRPRAAVVHLNFRAGSTFPVPVCTVSPDFRLLKQTLNRTSRCNKVDAIRLYASYRLNLLLPKGLQRCVKLGLFYQSFYFQAFFKKLFFLWLSYIHSHMYNVHYTLDVNLHIHNIQGVHEKSVFKVFYILEIVLLY